MMIPFSEALRRLRIEKGYSQQRLADTLHVDRSTVTKWETGDRVPDAVMMIISFYLLRGQLLCLKYSLIDFLNRKLKE